MQETSDLKIVSVDDKVIVPRSREVWIRDEQKKLNRAIKLLMQRGMSVDLHCLNPDCSDNTVTREQTAGGFELLCGCKRRVFNRDA